MRKTPFHEVGLEHGAEMIELFGYYLPWEYSSGHEKEHLATRHAASLCDLDYMGEFLIEGTDALAFIQKLMTNDYSKKSVGSIQYTAMCDTDGNMIDDGTVWRLGERKYMLVSGAEDDFAWIEKNVGGFDVAIQNITSEHTTLALQGPKTPEILSKVSNYKLETIAYYRFVEAKVAGVDCLLARMGYTGAFGYEVHFHPRHGRKIWSEIMTAGANVGIVPCGQAALESLRQEAGYLLVGNEHDTNTNPLEAGIGFVVKLHKPDFNGKQALMEIAERGVRRRIVWFDIPSGAVARTGDSILVANKNVGQVTSGSYSPGRKRGTAMGYVNPEHTIPGLTVTIESEGKHHDARLSVMPLYDPGDTITRAVPCHKI